MSGKYYLSGAQANITNTNSKNDSRQQMSGRRAPRGRGRGGLYEELFRLARDQAGSKYMKVPQTNLAYCLASLVNSSRTRRGGGFETWIRSSPCRFETQLSPPAAHPPVALL